MIVARVLGSGTSHGVPSLGRTYSKEFLAEPKNHRTRPSLLLSSEKGKLLVDCTPEMRLQLLAAKATTIDAVIVTHAHADHIMGMDDLRAFCQASNKAMPIFAWREVQEAIRRIYPYAFQEFPSGVEVPQFDLKDLEEYVQVGDIHAEILEVMHGKQRVAALRVNNFAYVTDVNCIPDAAWERLKGLEVLVLDAVRARPHPHHFHLEKAIEVSQSLGARLTYLTHLCDEYDHYPVESGLPSNVRLAYDGLEILV